ncbi:hypothetical protein B5808_18350 [Cnuibacter physcomitrellae]|uniref:Uncharacterized protein n=1 Tax=Cnuibacter physcomitrellae TaxID=1619308 RepID=A0A1X9LUN4_9MICO|nr:hypothetical protein B5808_18350 [Cnuibacter physcomitrellae]
MRSSPSPGPPPPARRRRPPSPSSRAPPPDPSPPPAPPYPSCSATPIEVAEQLGYGETARWERRERLSAGDRGSRRGGAARGRSASCGTRRGPPCGRRAAR